MEQEKNKVPSQDNENPGPEIKGSGLEGAAPPL